MALPTVDIIVDPLTPEGYAKLCEAIGKEEADRIALNAWRHADNLILRMFRLIDRAAEGFVHEIFLERPEGA